MPRTIAPLNKFGNIRATVAHFDTTHIAVRATQPAGKLSLSDTGLGASTRAVITQ